jgi:hypothetical protein
MWPRRSEGQVIQNNSNEERSKLIQIFRYIRALNQLRHPPQKEINYQPWILWFHDIPIHPCIRRGVVRASTTNIDEDDSSTVDDFILKVSRPISWRWIAALENREYSSSSFIIASATTVQSRNH